MSKGGPLGCDGASAISGGLSNGERSASLNRHLELGARLRGCATTHASKKGSEKVLGGFWGRALRRGLAMNFTVRKVLRRVVRRDLQGGAQKAPRGEGKQLLWLLS